MASSAILSMVGNTLLRYLTDRCTIEEAVNATDEYGGSEQTWTILVDDEPCRFIFDATRASATAPTGDRDSLRQSYRLIVGPDVALGVDQRVTDAAGNVYEVVEVAQALTDEVFRQAMVVRR